MHFGEEGVVEEGREGVGDWVAEEIGFEGGSVG